MDLYRLPEEVSFQGVTYPLNTDFRVILKIFSVFADRSLPESLRWRVALGLFYNSPVASEHQQQAMAYLADFLTCGETGKPGPELFSWQQDASAIIAGVNKVAGCEVRQLEKVHWWTFLGWFHAMGPGQLSTVVSIRDKLRWGKRLEDWEREFYRDNRELVDRKAPESSEQLEEKERLNRLLGD